MNEPKLPLFEILDDRFRDCTSGDQVLEVLYHGSRWAEGPIYLPAGRQLIWSDIPNDRLLRWDETTGTVGVFRAPAGFVNGNTMDRQGRLICCEQGNRRVTRTEHDGSITVLADRFEGKRFNSPNDATVRSDGLIYFSDPDYGILSDYEGHQADSEIGACHVYCLDPGTGRVSLAADGLAGPNGLVFAADERRLFVSDSRANHIKVFEVAPDGRLSGGDIFATCSNGNFDNIRFDRDGRLWAAAMAGGVHCYAGDGTLIGKVRVPEIVANITFGGPRRNQIFLAASTSLYSMLMPVTGAPPTSPGSG